MPSGQREGLFSTPLIFAVGVPKRFRKTCTLLLWKGTPLAEIKCSLFRFSVISRSNIPVFASCLILFSSESVEVKIEYD